MAIQHELFPNVDALWGPEVKSRGEEAPGRQWLALVLQSWGLCPWALPRTLSCLGVLAPWFAWALLQHALQGRVSTAQNPEEHSRCKEKNTKRQL